MNQTIIANPNPRVMSEGFVARDKAIEDMGNLKSILTHAPVLPNSLTDWATSFKSFCLVYAIFLIVAMVGTFPRGIALCAFSWGHVSHADMSKVA